MFLHGVGGLMLYLEMLKHVIALGHPVIVVEYKHVAMRLRWVGWWVGVSWLVCWGVGGGVVWGRGCVVVG